MIVFVKLVTGMVNHVSNAQPIQTGTEDHVLDVMVIESGTP
jgi:hypothetical protein